MLFLEVILFFGMEGVTRGLVFVFLALLGCCLCDDADDGVTNVSRFWVNGEENEEVEGCADDGYASDGHSKREVTNGWIRSCLLG